MRPYPMLQRRVSLDFPEMIMTALTGTSSAGRTIAKWKWDVLQEGQDMLLPNRLHLIRRLMARTGPNSENKNQRPIILKFGGTSGQWTSKGHLITFHRNATDFITQLPLPPERINELFHVILVGSRNAANANVLKSSVISARCTVSLRRKSRRRFSFCVPTAPNIVM